MLIFHALRNVKISLVVSSAKILKERLNLFTANPCECGLFFVACVLSEQ